jgi:hypothetical protein
MLISVSIEMLSRAEPIAGGGAFERIYRRKEVIGGKLEFYQASDCCNFGVSVPYHG